MEPLSLRLKLTLVNVLSFETNTPHFGLISLAAFVRSRMLDVDIRIIEGFDLFEEVCAQKSDIIGFTSDTLTFSKTLALAKKLKNRLPVPFIIGGVHITALQESLDPVFDLGVIGEGEETLVELLRIFVRERRWTKIVLEDIKGIVFHRGDSFVRSGPREPIKNIDDLPYPARDLVPMEEVFLKDQLNLFGVKRLVSIMTSRGCPYDCVFCGSPVQWGKVRFHSAAYVADEIQFLTDTYHIDGIMFWDDLFIAPKKRLVDLVERIKMKGLDRKLTFFGYARANLIDDEICRLLRSIRVKRLIFGLESGSEKILKYLKGGSVTVEDNARALRLCRAYGITTSSGFITGTPGEDFQDLKKTFDFIRHNKLDNTHIYILTPYPGTAMWEEARRNHLVTQGMDYGTLFVQLPGVRVSDFFKKSDPGLLEGRIFLNVPYRDKKEYIDLIFEMHKLAYARNTLFYLKVLFFDPGLVLRIIALKIKKVLYAR